MQSVKTFLKEQVLHKNTYIAYKRKTYQIHDKIKNFVAMSLIKTYGFKFLLCFIGRGLSLFLVRQEKPAKFIGWSDVVASNGFCRTGIFTTLLHKNTKFTLTAAGILSVISYCNIDKFCYQQCIKVMVPYCVKCISGQI